VKILLDTHTFIWWDSQPERLSQLALGLCEDPENDLFLSVVSLWEIQVKSQLGKIRMTPIRWPGVKRRNSPVRNLDALPRSP